jgi:hypothetical protein
VNICPRDIRSSEYSVQWLGPHILVRAFSFFEVHPIPPYD